MSVLNWIMDLDQEGRINELVERNEKLQKRVEVAEGWVRYLNDRIDKLEQQKSVQVPKD